MKVVFILIIYMSANSGHGGPVVIDNIESRESCELLASQIKKTWPVTAGSSECYPVKRSN